MFSAIISSKIFSFLFYLCGIPVTQVIILSSISSKFPEALFFFFSPLFFPSDCVISIDLSSTSLTFLSFVG